ncbi:MAG: hypothetical protein N2C14_10285, partial [Planctomycetales bacterium]
LRLTHLKNKAHLIAESPWLDRVTGFDFSECNFKLSHLTWLLSSPHLTNLEELNLDHTSQSGGFGANAIRLASELPQLAGLRRISAVAAGVGGNDTLQHLADSPHLRNLEFLDLGGNPIMDFGGETLAESETLTAIRELNLRGSGIGDRMLSALANNSHVRSLRRLVLDENEIAGDGLRALLNSPVAAALEFLSLESNEIDDFGALACIGSPNLGNLKHLYLGGNAISDDAAKTLRESELGRRLDNLETRVPRQWRLARG